MTLIEDLVRASAGTDRGACCRFHEDRCDELAELDCLGGGGTLNQFYPGRTCDEIGCFLDACCVTIQFPDQEPYQECLMVAGLIDCLVAGGEWKGTGSQCVDTPCEPPPPDDTVPGGCMKADGVKERPATGFTWSLDLCQNAQSRVVIRPPNEWPVAPFDREWVTMNYGEAVTVGPIRAFQTVPGENPCRRHYSKLVRKADGYVRMMSCGQHDRADPDGYSVSEGRFYLENDSVRPTRTIHDPIPNGYAAVAWAYRAPDWVEAHYNSHQVFCGIIV